MENLNDYFVLCIDGESITEENLLESLKQVLRVQLQNIDDIVTAAQEDSSGLRDVINDAKCGIAYAMRTALSVGQTAECNKIMRIIRENVEN